MEKSVVINEQQLLKCILLDLNNIFQVDTKYFLSSISKKIINTIFQLLEKNIDVTFDQIVVEAKDDSIDLNVLQSIEQREIVDLEYHYKLLKQNYIKDKFGTEIGRDIISKFSISTDLDIPAIENIIEKAQGYIQELKEDDNKNKKIYSLKESYILYKSIIEERANGLRNYSSGCSYLDHYIFRGLVPGEMTAIYADSGVGKSTFTQYLFMKQINRQIPSIYFTPENSLELTIDRLVCMKNRIPFNWLYPNQNDQHEIAPLIFEKIEEEINKLKKNSIAFICDQPIISIKDLEKYIKDLKRIYHFDYMVAHLDLASMFTEFNEGHDTKASNYEDAMNLLHFTNKKLGCHFINVFQAKGIKERVTVKSVDDLIRFKPQIELIKNSGAIKERHRLVLGLFRKKYYALQFLPDDPETIIMNDILDVYIQKQNSGGLHHLKYFYDPTTYYINKFIEEE